MLIVKLILKLIKILNQDATPSQIAGGMALGSILGITPLASLHNMIVFLLIFLVRVNITTAFFSWGLFTLFSYLFDPVFNKIGYTLLVKVQFLKPIWTTLYNTPIVPWTKFNNTLTLGSLVCALVLFWPLFFFLKWFVRIYREILANRLQKLKIVQILKASKIFSLYRQYG